MREVARLLGCTEPWAIERLERFRPFIGHSRYSTDVTVEAECVTCAMYLRDWLPMYIQAYELVGEDPPEVLEDTFAQLDDLITFLQSDFVLSLDISKGGPKPDRRKRLCALVCQSIWSKAQPYSTKLADACDAYWRACGHVGEDHPINWDHYLSHP